MAFALHFRSLSLLPSLLSEDPPPLPPPLSPARDWRVGSVAEHEGREGKKDLDELARRRAKRRWTQFFFTLVYVRTVALQIVRVQSTLNIDLNIDYFLTLKVLMYSEVISLN